MSMKRGLTIVAAIFIAMIAAPSAAAQQAVDGTGDLDLDGISCSISDLGYYTSYFVLGLGAFAPLPAEQVIANSDINADGLPLTVSDLIAMQQLVLQQEHRRMIRCRCPPDPSRLSSNPHDFQCTPFRRSSQATARFPSICD
jgi:hypothetical protein